MRCDLLLGAGVLVLTACGGEDGPPPSVPPRPVTILELSDRVPRSELRATGVVEPYRESYVGFEVAGRIATVADVGREVNGPLLDGDGGLLLGPDGEPRRLGEVIATLDDTRYRQAVTAAELRLASTREQLEAQTIDLERVASSDLEAAKAQEEASGLEVESGRDEVSAAQAALDLATSTVERNRGLIGSGAISQSVLDQSEAELRTATARLRQAQSAVAALLQVQRAAQAQVSKAEGAILLKEAEIRTTESSLAEQENELARARTDLASCVLRAPFNGRITGLDAATGSFVQAGAPVVSLVMMAPVKVVLTASAELDREILQGMGVRVFPSQGTDELLEQGVVGTVYEKGEVADPSTRTFRVGVMVRNPLLTGDGRAGPEGGAAPGTDIFPVISPTLEFDGPLLVNVACVLEEDGDTYVLQLPNLQLERTQRDLGATYVPQKVRVVLNDTWDQIDRWTLRGLEDSGGLVAGDALVVDPTPARIESVTVGSRQWAFRPGDIVQVALDVGLPPRGFWVPVSSIRAQGETSAVFRVSGGRTERVTISVHEAFGELRRVEGDELRAGDRLLADGVHYVAEGDPVEVVASVGE